MKESNIGSSFDDFLVEEGIYEEVTAAAINKVLATQLALEMEKQHLNKVELAGRMKSSRATLDKLLNPDSTSINLETIEKAARVLGKKVELRLV